MRLFHRLYQFLAVPRVQSELGAMSRLYFDVTSTIIKYLFVKSLVFSVLALFLGYFIHAVVLALFLPIYVFSNSLLKRDKIADAGNILMAVEHIYVCYLSVFLGAKSGVFLFCFIYVVLAFFLFRDQHTRQRWLWVGISIGVALFLPNIYSNSHLLLPVSNHPYAQLVVMCISILLLSSILIMLQTLNSRCVNRLEVLYQEEEDQHQRTVDRLTYQHLFQNIVSGIADEIRNPLAAIFGRIEIMERDSKSATRDELIDLIEHKLQRIVRLTQSMLEYSSAPKSVAEIDVNGVLRDVINSLNNRITENTVSTVNDIKPLPKITGDSDKLFQVFYNIILNALESFSGADRNELALKTGVIEGSIFVLVTDNGCGIERGHYRSIFRPFFSTKQNRSGLGLAIAVQNIALFGGRISVESNQGFGTSIRVVIPIRGESLH
jgi:signal transduction histidine kinase